MMYIYGAFGPDDHLSWLPRRPRLTGHASPEALPATLVGVAGTLDAGRPGHPRGLPVRPRAHAPGAGRRRLLLPLRSQSAGQRARLHQPVPVRPPWRTPRGPVGIVPSTVHLPRSHTLGSRSEDLPGRTDLVLHPGCGRHRGVRPSRTGDRRPPGRPHRRLPGRRVPEHLDDRRTGAVRDHRPLAGGRGALVHLPLLEASHHGPGRRAGRGHRRGHAGSGRAHPAGGLHPGSHGPAGPGPLVEAPPGHARDRSGQCGPGGGALGGVQPEPVPEAGLHQQRPRGDPGLGRLRHHLLGPVRGLLVDAVRAGLRPQPLGQRSRRRLGGVLRAPAPGPRLRPGPRPIGWCR